MDEIEKWAALPEIKCWKSAFVCLHELGHYFMDHSKDCQENGWSAKREIHHEIEANDWAKEKWEELLGELDPRINDLVEEQLCERLRQLMKQGELK